MQKFAKLGIALALGSVLAATASAAALKDGTWTGEGQGRNGAVVVEMTVKSGHIADVKVVKHSETAGISDAALARMPGEIVKAQSTGVDAVTGATMTSNGIKGAVANAIRAAGGDPAQFAAAVVTKKAAKKVIINIGTK